MSTPRRHSPAPRLVLCPVAAALFVTLRYRIPCFVSYFALSRSSVFVRVLCCSWLPAICPLSCPTCGYSFLFSSTCLSSSLSPVFPGCFLLFPHLVFECVPFLACRPWCTCSPRGLSVVCASVPLSSPVFVLECPRASRLPFCISLSFLSNFCFLCASCVFPDYPWRFSYPLVSLSLRCYW